MKQIIYLKQNKLFVLPKVVFIPLIIYKYNINDQQVCNMKNIFDIDVRHSDEFTFNPFFL